MAISDKIQELRKQNGMSQEQLAEKMGVSRQAVSKWESGICAPDIEKIIALSGLFGVSIDYLIKGEEAEALKENTVQAMNVSQNPKVKKYTWLIAIPVGFLFCFIVWNMGQEIGDDIGRFIYNIRK